MPDSLKVSMRDNRNVSIQGYWPIPETMPASIQDQAARQPTYVLFYAACEMCVTDGIAPTTWPLAQEVQYQRPDGTFMTIYKVKD